MDAGADVYLRDGTGLNALDYATDLPQVPQILVTAGSSPEFTDAATTISISRQTVLECCKLLKDLAESEFQIPEQFKYLNINIMLARSLLRLGDFETYAVCFMMRYWPLDLVQLQETITCKHCARSSFPGDVYICKSCSSEYFLCRKCHVEYTENKSQYPSALDDLHILESRVRLVRVALPAGLGIAEILNILYLFGPEAWITPTINGYDSWEQEHNAKGEYASIARPGQEFLSIMSSARQNIELAVKDPTLVDEPALQDSNKKLLDRFERLSWEHPPSKLLSQLRCSGHEYLVVEEQHREKLKTEGLFLDSETGRLTINFLQSIQEKYHNAQKLASGPLALTVDESMNGNGVVPDEFSSSNAKVASQSDSLYRAMASLDLDKFPVSNGPHDRAGTLPIPGGHHLSQQNLHEIDKIKTNTLGVEEIDVLAQIYSEQSDHTVLRVLGDSANTALDSIFLSGAPSPLENRELLQDLLESVESESEEALNLTLAILRQPITTWNIERLRLAFLQFYNPPEDDETVVTWAIALQVYYALDPTFCSALLHARSEAMAAQMEEQTAQGFGNAGG